MSGLALQSMSKQFGTFAAVDDVSLTVPHGTFVCLLGPSGCGKTTLLRMIAGLEQPTAGAILLDGEDITPVPTHKRDLGMVFQSLALFPHLTVGDNIAYPLRIRGAAQGGAAPARRGAASSWSTCRASPTARCRKLVRRPAPARRDRPGAGHLAQALPARRAAFGARRQAARGDAGRAAAAAAAARHHHHRRHPRPARGDDHGRPGGGHGPAAEIRQAAVAGRHLPPARPTPSSPTSSARPTSCRCRRRRAAASVCSARQCPAWRCPPAAAKRSVSVRPEDVHLVAARSGGDRRHRHLRARSRRHDRDLRRGRRHRADRARRHAARAAAMSPPASTSASCCRRSDCVVLRAMRREPPRGLADYAAARLPGGRC